MAFRCLLSLAFMGIVVMACSRFGEPPSSVYRRFSDALQDRDSLKLQEAISFNTLIYLDRMAEWVLRGEKEDIEKLDAFERFFILFLRLQNSDWSQKDWKQYADARGSGDAEPLDSVSFDLIEYYFSGLRIGRVSFYEGIAGGFLYLNGNLYPTRIRFADEEGWKVDVLGFIRDRFEYALREYSTDQYRNRDLVEEILRNGFGESFSIRLYDPPLDPHSI